MYMSFRKATVGIAALVVVLFIGGCSLFGFGSGSLVPEPNRLEGTLSGPADVANVSGAGSTAHLESRPAAAQRFAALFDAWKLPTAAASLRLLPGEQPLEDVPVGLFQWDQLLAGADEPVQTTRTGPDGTFTFGPLPSGTDWVVVTLTEPRLSGVAVETGPNATMKINSATTLASEALAQHALEQDESLDKQRWAQGVADIEDVLADLDLDQERLLDALSGLIPPNFGSGLPETPPAVWAPLAAAVTAAVADDDDGRSDNGDDTYEVEGIVFDKAERGVADVEISFGEFGSVFTDADGTFHKDGLSGEVTVTAVEADTFIPVDSEWTPASVTVNEATWITFFGEVLVPVDPPFTVSGAVQRPDGTPVEDVEIRAQHHDAVALTDVTGVFTMSDIGYVTVITPTKEGYIFEPAYYPAGADTVDVQFTAHLVDEVSITFADPNLEEAVREALRYDLDSPDAPITTEHVPRLTSLAAWNISISDLSGLEHFVHLDTLYIGYDDNSGLHGLSPLESLDNLRMVVIRNSSVTDISPLAGKARMAELNLENNAIEDVSAVATLPNLHKLALSGNPLSDLSPLANWQRSESAFSLAVHLDDTLIENVNALQHMDNWNALYLSDTPYLTDITALLHTPVTYVDLRNTPALDWCDDNSTWRIVDAILAREGGRVFTNTPCMGEYTLSGIIDLDNWSHYTPDNAFYVTFEGQHDFSFVEAELQGDVFVWEHTVEGSVIVAPRMKSKNAASIPWEFEPSRRVGVDGPESNMVFTARRHESDANVIQGYVEDDFGQPVVDAEVRLVQQASGIAIATIKTDGMGYFHYTFTSPQQLDIYAEKDGWVFAPVLGVITPRQVRLSGERDSGGTIAFIRSGQLRTIGSNGADETDVADVGTATSLAYEAVAPLLTWSPDAGEIAYVRADGSHDVQLRIVDANGSGDRQLVALRDVDVRVSSWHADHGIVYSRRQLDGHQPMYNPWQLWVTGAGGGAGQQLAAEGHVHYYGAQWSPDGSQLVTIAANTEPAGSPGTIHTMNADGTDLSQPLADGYNPVWSPMGDAIAYEDEGDIYVYDVFADMSTLAVADGVQPTWSPDGAWLAFQRDGSIYIVNVEKGLDPIYLTDGTHPLWSPF